MTAVDNHPESAPLEPSAGDCRASAGKCLLAVAQHHGLSASAQKIGAHLDEPCQGEALVRAAEATGLKAKTAQLGWENLLALAGAFPAIARLNNANFVVVVGVKRGESGADGSEVAVLDPLAKPANSILLVSKDSFCASWSGEVVLLKREYPLFDENQPFGLRWFFPELARQKGLLRDVAIAALTLHVLALAVPIFIQLVIDKVVVHRGYSTLWVLTIGVMVALVFEAVFTFLRQYLLLYATNRVDIRLAQKTFAHLLRLPITYFDTGVAGVIVRHMQQVEKIRQFLTGRLFMTMLDASVLVIFLPVLFAYSPKLATLVLLFAAVIGAVVFLLIGPYRIRLQALYRAEGDRQSILVETIQGMRTVKSLALEEGRRKEWERRSVQAVKMHFSVAKIASTANVAMSFLEKLMMVAIIAVGANDVFDQTLTVGALIAFNMLSGRVVHPLVQIVGLVNEYQETGLSIRMLGEIMNRPAEGKPGDGGLQPPIRGRIEFEEVSFRYTPEGAAAINRITFAIPPGKVVGIVGRSGSGKTTLTRLMQGLYPVQEGVIRVDGVDAREIDLAHLRKNIGVVLQDNFLFRGTVRENIALTRPGASFEEIVAAAKLSGAEEFIERLPQGYDTLLEENGANLSGGQKQRLAIARAVLPQPRILILDEAASALDPESEAIFLRNLGQLVKGRTVIIISHRLSTLTSADAVVVMDRGRIIDAGPHADLLKRCKIYIQLWEQQTSHL